MESLANHLIAARGRPGIGPRMHLGRRFNCWCRNQHVLLGKDRRGSGVNPYPQPLLRSLKIPSLFLRGMDPKIARDECDLDFGAFARHVGCHRVGLTLPESFQGPPLPSWLVCLDALQHTLHTLSCLSTWLHIVLSFGSEDSVNSFIHSSVFIFQIKKIPRPVCLAFSSCVWTNATPYAYWGNFRRSLNVTSNSSFSC